MKYAMGPRGASVSEWGKRQRERKKRKEKEKGKRERNRIKCNRNRKQTVTGKGISIGLVNNPRRQPVPVQKQGLTIKKKHEKIYKVIIIKIKKKT